MTRGRRRGKAATVAELFFDGLMLLFFISQAFVLGCLLTYGHLPLPTKWVTKAISGQLPDGISIRSDSYALTLDGKIRVKNIQLLLDGIRQPVFNAEYAHVEFDARWDKDAPFSLNECTLSNGILTLPAVYSPSGKDSSILDHIALRLLPTKNGLAVDSFAALHEDIRLRGSIKWVPKNDTLQPPKVREQADLFFKQVANALKQKQLIDGFTQPTIFFQVESGHNSSLNILSRVSSRAYNRPNIQAKNLTLDVTLSLTDQTLVSQSSILLEADEIELPAYKTRASYVSTKVQRDDWEALLKGEWPNMEVMADELEIEEISLKSPRINLNAKAFPEIAFNGSTSGLKGAVQFSGLVNANTRAATIQAAGSLDLLSIASKSITKRLPAITVNEAPYYNLDLSFNEGFSLNKAELRARVDTLGVKDLDFDHIRFRGSYKDGVYSINRLYMRRDWQWLNLGFNLDSTTYDYAVTLKGSAKPYDYNSILPRWWGGIFKKFDFEQVEDGLGDFVIYGNSGNNAADFFFGHARAKNVAYRGVRIDEGELLVRGRGPYAEIYKLNARTGEGFARGDIRFTSRLDEVKGPMSVRLNLDTKLPLSDAQKLFDEDIASILSDFKTEALPRTSLKGAIFNNSYPEFNGLSYIDLTANCPVPLTYKEIPLDYLGFDLIGRKGVTYLRDMQFGYASGEGKAKADILTSGEGPAQARFKASLINANQDQAIKQLSYLKKDKSSQENVETASSEGRLSFEIHARGPVEDPFNMNGFGSLQIENEKLYAIQLFGPLSKLVQNTPLGFTSFALNQMQADFALKEGIVSFKKLEINGPKSRIEAPGTMRLDDLSLSMRVSVYLFGNAGNPKSNIRKISNLITKSIPNLLEFELTGTAEDQKWRSLYDPRKFIPKF